MKAGESSNVEPDTVGPLPGTQYYVFVRIYEGYPLDHRSIRGRLYIGDATASAPRLVWEDMPCTTCDEVRLRDRFDRETEQVRFEYNMSMEGVGWRQLQLQWDGKKVKPVKPAPPEEP